MNIKKFMSKTAIVAVSIGLVAASAHAKKPNNPPEDSGRPVIEQATVLCGASAAFDLGAKSDQEIFLFACGLLSNSDGALVAGDGCNVNDAGNSDISYTGRICHKNKAAQQRKASSVVLSMDDVITRDKTEQALTAANYACEYASKATALVGVKKLDLQGNDLIADAEDIADALGYPCD